MVVRFVLIDGYQSHLTVVQFRNSQKDHANVGGVVAVGDRHIDRISHLHTGRCRDRLLLHYGYTNIRVGAAVAVLDAVQVLFKQRAQVVAIRNTVVIVIFVAGIADSVAVRVSLSRVRSSRAVVLGCADSIAVRITLDRGGDLVLHEIVIRVRVVRYRLACYVCGDLDRVAARRWTINRVLDDDIVRTDVRHVGHGELLGWRWRDGDNRRVRIQRVGPMRVACSRANQLKVQVGISRAGDRNGHAKRVSKTCAEQISLRVVVAGILIFHHLDRELR